jgi:protein subunit release factor B
MNDLSGYRSPQSDEDLLEECDVMTFRASGKGGQHVNKTESAVRLVHRPSGIVTVCSRERSQYLNKCRCLKNLREKIERATYKDPPRIATKVPRSANRNRLEIKSKKTKKKELRKRVVGED